MKKITILALLSLFAMPAFAQELNYEIGYTSVSADDSGLSIDLGAIYGSIGYEWRESGNYTNEAEGVVLFGVTDDSFGSVTIELNPTIEVAYRGTWDSSSPDLKFFWRAAYTRIVLEASSSFGGGSEDADETGFGLGVGAEWQGFTLGYNQYFGDLEDFSRINIGYRF